MKGKNSFFFLLSIACLLFPTSCDKPQLEASKDAEVSRNTASSADQADPITFLSTQMNPVEEAGKMRNVLLKNFPGQVDFRPNDNSYLFSQLDTTMRGDPGASIVIGALHGDLVKLHENGVLLPMTDLYKKLDSKHFSENLLALSRLDGQDSYYFPWMQASFVMVANKKALPYLPKDADLNELTYEQLSQWANNIFDKTGKKVIGLPAGDKGLLHRFFQGYLYPSFTASTLLKFRSPEAHAMWYYFKNLWRFVHPGSLVYSTMSDPLLVGDVWIAWDHTARLVKAFEQRPEDFIAFPAPIGPKGRGFMAVISGLAIPKGLADPYNPAILIDYLTRPEIQVLTLKETGFFPVVALGENEGIPIHLRELSGAVDKQVGSRKSIPALLPIGLGERAGDFNNVFMLTFSEIVLDEKEIAGVLDVNAEELQSILTEENAKCWLPDVSEERPCKIE